MTNPLRESGGDAPTHAGPHREGTHEERRFRRSIEALALLAAAATVAATYLVEGSVLVPTMVALGFALAVVDTAFGMGYGTLATPLLLLSGFVPIAIVPAVLLSQALAAAIATALHVKYKNVDLFDLKGADARMSAAIIAFGLAGALAAVILAVRLPSLYVKAYIGLLVVSMGLLLVAKPRFRFSWGKVFTVSLLNGFDKAISGGGFGPVAVGGLLTLGQNIRNAVGIAVFTVTIINGVSVFLYLLMHAVVPSETFLMITLSTGAVIGSLIGPGITGRLNTKGHMNWLALVMILVGVLALLSAVSGI